MGTGKSSVGRSVAAQLKFDFIDTDDLIEQRAGCRISDIFEQEGEARFRNYESEVVRGLESVRGAVIATGGGLVMNPDNMVSLKKHAIVVCLWARPAIIWQRVRHQSHRPLLHHPDPLVRIRELLEERGPAYRAANVLVNTDLRSLPETIHHVLHHYRIATQNTKLSRHS